MSHSVATRNDDTPATLNGLLLPLADRTLLLPNVALAELTPYQIPQAIAGAPAWLIGRIGWRNLMLPLLSFEAASGGQALSGSHARVAILNAIGGNPRIKFIALLVQGIPRSIKVDSSLPGASSALAPLELAAVQVGDDVAKIPDLVALEQLLSDVAL